MKRYWRRPKRNLAVGVAMIVACILAVNTGGLVTRARADTIDRVVASVDGEPITSHDEKVYNASNSTSAASGGAPAEPQDPDEVLKELIQDRMLKLEARNYAGQVTDDEIDRYIQNLEQTNHITDEQLHAQLRADGVSDAEFRNRMREQVEAMTMIDKEVREKIVVPESEIAGYYQTHLADFTITDEKYRLAQILIAVPKNATPQQVMALRDKALAVRKQAVKGADFGTLALQYSDDDSKTKGGELGWFLPSNLNDQVEAGIKNLKVGGISNLIRTKYGFHIIKVEEHQVPGVEPLSQVRSEIRNKIQSEQARGDFEKWVDTDLAKQHYVETLQ
ncbi:MAG TPA: peptidylprolyl isomerase [Candidatus Binataceae bacterium]|nr:peptidylprolyl isomerase [Candidatus Binataceae bacterium]